MLEDDPTSDAIKIPIPMTDNDELGLVSFPNPKSEDDTCALIREVVKILALKVLPSKSHATNVTPPKADKEHCELVSQGTIFPKSGIIGDVLLPEGAMNVVSKSTQAKFIADKIESLELRLDHNAPSTQASETSTFGEDHSKKSDSIPTDVQVESLACSREVPVTSNTSRDNCSVTHRESNSSIQSGDCEDQSNESQSSNSLASSVLASISKFALPRLEDVLCPIEVRPPIDVPNLLSPSPTNHNSFIVSRRTSRFDRLLDEPQHLQDSAATDPLSHSSDATSRLKHCDNSVELVQTAENADARNESEKKLPDGQPKIIKPILLSVEAETKHVSKPLCEKSSSVPTPAKVTHSEVAKHLTTGRGSITKKMSITKANETSSGIRGEPLHAVPPTSRHNVEGKGSVIEKQSIVSNNTASKEQPRSVAWTKRNTAELMAYTRSSHVLNRLPSLTRKTKVRPASLPQAPIDTYARERQENAAKRDRVNEELLKNVSVGQKQPVCRDQSELKTNRMAPSNASASRRAVTQRSSSPAPKSISRAKSPPLTPLFEICAQECRRRAEESAAGHKRLSRYAANDLYASGRPNAIPKPAYVPLSDDEWLVELQHNRVCRKCKMWPPDIWQTPVWLVTCRTCGLLLEHIVGVY